MSAPNMFPQQKQLNQLLRTEPTALCLGQAITDWVDGGALRFLVERFGGTFPAHGDLPDRLVQLVAFSACWDFRGGSERAEVLGIESVDSMMPELSPAFEALGLVSVSLPEERDFAQVLVLGGTLRSCVDRTELAASLVVSETIRTSTLVALGTMRAPAPQELRALDSRFAGVAEGTTEFDMLCLAAERALGRSAHVEIDNHAEEPARREILRMYEGRPLVAVCCSPAGENRQRANTADTYAHFARALGPKPGSLVVICTTQIYAPYQLIDAVRSLTLPFGVGLRVVGVEPPPGSGMFTAKNYLQETRSALRAAQGLVSAIAPSS